MRLCKGDIIVFDPAAAGFYGFKGMAKRSVDTVLKDGTPVVSMNGFRQRVRLSSIVRVLPVKEWREVSLGDTNE